LIVEFGLDDESVLDALTQDCAVHGSKGCPGFLHERLRGTHADNNNMASTTQRQARHLRA